MKNRMPIGKELQPRPDDRAVFTLDLAGNIQSVNETAERLTGYRTAELTRLNVLDLLPGKSAADLRAIAKRSVRHRFGTVFEIEITTRNRQPLVLEVSIDLVRRVDRQLEFHGIAVAKNNAAGAPLRPRCLDLRFKSAASKQLTAEPLATG